MWQYRRCVAEYEIDAHAAARAGSGEIHPALSSRLPTNDACVSLGQVMVALQALR
jgi:hydrogenase maturation factor HypF (carbamoyltransferase family)